MATAKEIAAKDVVTAVRSDTISDVVTSMRDANVGSVVIEEEGLPVGIVTDRQIALALADDSEVGHEVIDSVMTRDLVTVSETASVFHIAQTMSEAGIRRTPIVDDDGELVGLVALDDVLHVIKEEFDLIEDVLAAQSDRF